MKEKIKIIDGIEKIFKKDGYIRVRCGRTWVLEHKLVVEEFIGRLLKEKETIHHINGNRSDNRIENLMLFTNQKEHKSFENKVRQFGMTNTIKKQIKERWNEFI